MCKKLLSPLRLIYIFCVFVCCWFIKSPKKRHRRNRSNSITLNMIWEKKLKRNCHNSTVPNQNMPSYSFHIRYNYSIYDTHTHGITLHGKSVSRFSGALKFVKHISTRIEKFFKKLATTRDACMQVGTCVPMKCNAHYVSKMHVAK